MQGRGHVAELGHAAAEVEPGGAFGLVQPGPFERLRQLSGGGREHLDLGVAQLLGRLPAQTEHPLPGPGGHQRQAGQRPQRPDRGRLLGGEEGAHLPGGTGQHRLTGGVRDRDRVAAPPGEVAVLRRRGPGQPLVAGHGLQAAVRGEQEHPGAVSPQPRDDGLHHRVHRLDGGERAGQPCGDLLQQGQPCRRLLRLPAGQLLGGQEPRVLDGDRGLGGDRAHRPLAALVEHRRAPGVRTGGRRSPHRCGRPPTSTGSCGHSGGEVADRSAGGRSAGRRCGPCRGRRTSARTGR